MLTAALLTIAALLGGGGAYLFGGKQLRAALLRIGQLEAQVVEKDETIKQILKEKANAEEIHASQPADIGDVISGL